MILANNRTILRVKNRELLNRLIELENQVPTGNVIVESAKTGAPTLKLLLEDHAQYVHSKYNPVNEAERFISQFKMEETKHVLFIGAGLGYHIEAFIATHPGITFSIYEPNEEVLLTYFAHTTLNRLAEQNLCHIFTGHHSDHIDLIVQQLSELSKGKLKIITLPVYDKIYSKQIVNLTTKIVDALKQRNKTLAINIAFQKRWIVNAIKNLPIVLNTPNILHDIDNSMFVGKPAIIVSAGPSLNEEIEHLRYIKNNGLAYIFSVGSSINALIEHGIYPDAACTYDPLEINYKVIQKIKDKKLDTIPLIFGSTVGYETLENYPGRLLHMVTSQDTIAPPLLKHNETANLDFVYDAPSIAIIMFQTLCKLGFSQIILVGQNLAFLSDKYYADGISTTSCSEEVLEQSLANVIIVKDVHGHDVKSTEGYITMLKQFEMYIARNKHTHVVNTTRGGAAIAGSTYKPLSQLLEQQLTKKVVCHNWFEAKNNYNRNYLDSQLESMIANQKQLSISLQSTISTLEIIQQKALRKTLSTIENDYTTLNNQFKRIEQNSFYRYFMAPMFRVQYEQFIVNISSLQKEMNTINKAEKLVQEYEYIITTHAEHYELAVELFTEMKEQLYAQ